MNILKVMNDALQVVEQGKAIKNSTFLTNAEASGAMLYGLLSAIVMLLSNFNIDLGLNPDQVHAMANGWTVTISFVYGIYRLITNPAAGIKVHK